jgi:hypothetical protein
VSQQALQAKLSPSSACRWTIALAIPEVGHREVEDAEREAGGEADQPEGHHPGRMPSFVARDLREVRRVVIGPGGVDQRVEQEEKRPRTNPMAASDRFKRRLSESPSMASSS